LPVTVHFSIVSEPRSIDKPREKRTDTKRTPSALSTFAAAEAQSSTTPSSPTIVAPAASYSGP